MRPCADADCDEPAAEGQTQCVAHLAELAKLNEDGLSHLVEAIHHMDEVLFDIAHQVRDGDGPFRRGLDVVIDIDRARARASDALEKFGLELERVLS